MINQDVIIENTKQFVNSTLMSAEGGHDWFHVERVLNTAVYIAKNEKHGLKNNGKETLKFYWIFPTDRFSEVEYLY